jgi:hypothetical protein
MTVPHEFMPPQIGQKESKIGQGHNPAVQADEGRRLQEIVQTALSRSLGAVPQTALFEGGIVILPGESSSWDGKAAFRCKALVFGTPPPAMLPALGLRQDAALPGLDGRDACAPAVEALPFTESDAFLAYREHPLAAGLAAGIRRRPFTRFDYADEWNNLGFGRIRTDGSIWAAQGGLIPDGALELAGIHIQARKETGGTKYAGAYLTLLDTPEASILWCSRPVGPLDSTEWSIIERFISDWRADDMPCLPCLCQTPANCRCLVTMRLDCDEDIGSARDIFEWYAGERIPFSLAVKTSVDMGPEDMRLLDDVRMAGGTLLSHTHTHQLNWGADFEAALTEAKASRRWFAATWPDITPADLAVSPFHTNPPYAVQAMARAGFSGFVSGIIHNDPEYLLGRGGVVPFADGIVSISQQSMLHGDSYRRQGQRVDVHIAAFEAQYAAGGIFGYLDHPFSMRYQYDWESKAQRLQAHQKLVAAIRHYDAVWFWSQRQCFDFITTLSSTQLRMTSDGKVLLRCATPGKFGIKYRYMGQEYAIKASGNTP